MKKYLAISITSNLILSILASNGLTNYLNLSVSKVYNSTTDLLVLLGVVLVNILFNFALFKYLKVNTKKIYFLIPVMFFMIGTGIGILIIK